MTKLLDKPTFPCRDCHRDIRWMKDTNDTKGPRCYDCAVKHRAEAAARALAREVLG